MAQSYKNIEIILVNDGSPDNCGEICDEYAVKDKRVKVIHKDNGGLSDAQNSGIEISSGKYLMFVDSDDYISNKMCEILRWFINNVMPNVNNAILYVVGRGTENWQEEFKDVSNVKIIGGVESLKDYYEKADAVVSPIFLGSGMKTKTAEALMYGKYIFATREAFEGYDVDYDEVGVLCNTKEDFIKAINEDLQKLPSRFNEYSRRVFLEKYSNDVWKDRIKKFLES